MALRLTKSMREGIIRRIMADIPTVDIVSIAREELMEAAVKALPQPVRAIWKDAKYQAFVRIENLYTDCGAISVAIPASRDVGNRYDGEQHVGAEAWGKFKARCGELRAQSEARRAIAKELELNLLSVSTTKAFAERFPDLASYLPPVTDIPANLPATTALIDALAAAGLPAAKKEA